VEDALRRPLRLSYLGEHALANWPSCSGAWQAAEPGFVTHIDRGKAVSDVLVQAMEKLTSRKTRAQPLAVPSREWHLFLVLHAATW